MRVALMALPEDGGAQVRLSGRPVAWHQLCSILALGCERIVCLADAPSPTLAALQREAEGREVKFHAIAHHRALSGLVSAADTLFAFAPGVLPDREWLIHALGGRAGVAILPAEVAIERGYERIDRERAWGGVLAVRGDAVEALAVLPADADPIAGLLRIGLQRGARPVEVPEPWLDDGRWALLADAAAAQRAEESWQARHVPAPSTDRPGEVLAHRIAKVLLPRAADTPSLAPASEVGGVALALAGGAVGYLGHTVSGLVLLTLGTLVAQVGTSLRLFASAGSEEPSARRLPPVRDALIDFSLVAIALSPAEFAGWTIAFVAAVLVLAIRFAREDQAQRPVRWLGDRLTVFAMLPLAAAAGGFAPAAAALGIIALAGRLFWPARTG